MGVSRYSEKYKKRFFNKIEPTTMLQMIPKAVILPSVVWVMLSSDA
jgi:hypothetical protein